MRHNPALSDSIRLRGLSTKTNSPLWSLVPLTLLGVLAGLILFSPHELRYDEEFHIATASRVQSLGWRGALLSPDNSSAAGPLYSAVQVMFKDVTRLKAPAIRWINFVFLLATIAVIALMLRRQSSGGVSWIQACSVMAAPFLWPTAGLALTELPALFFFTAFVAAITSPSAFSASAGRALVQGAFAGALLAVSILGRQTYLIALGPALLIAIAYRKWRVPIGTCIVVALAGCIWLFFLWGGLVPPTLQRVDQGLRPDYGLYSLSYLGVASLFLGPSWLVPETKRRWITAIVAGIALASFTAFSVDPPARTLLVRSLGDSGARGAGIFIRSLMCVLAMLWLIRVAEEAWKARREPQRLLVILLLLALAVAPIKVSHLFSSRYVVGALAVQLLTQAHAVERNARALALQTCAGGLIGAMLLWTYYW
jgi:hypothetical protein